MKRCDGETCETIVNEKGRAFKRLRDMLFCSEECYRKHLASLGLQVVGSELKPKSKALVRVTITGG